MAITVNKVPVKVSPTQQRNGIGFFGMLTILFIGLKLTGNIDWSWWWVLSPLWLVPAIILGIVIGGGLIFLLGVGIVFGVSLLVDSIQQPLRRRRARRALAKRNEA